MSSKIEKYTPQVMAEIANLLDNILNEDDSREIGFALLIFETEKEGGQAKYVSNCERMDMLRAVQEWIDNAKMKMN